MSIILGLILFVCICGFLFEEKGCLIILGILVGILLFFILHGVLDLSFFVSGLITVVIIGSCFLVIYGGYVVSEGAWRGAVDGVKFILNVLEEIDNSVRELVHFTGYCVIRIVRKILLKNGQKKVELEYGSIDELNSEIAESLKNGDYNTSSELGLSGRTEVYVDSDSAHDETRVGDAHVIEV